MMITRTVAEHTRALLNYLPGGPLFASRNVATSNVYKFMTGIASEFLTADDLIKTFRIEIIPSLSESLIPEWEAALGIPDDCFKADGDIATRRTHVLAKLASLGIQTTTDFETLAAVFGVTVSVVPGIVENGISDADDRFRIYVRHTELPTDTFPMTFPLTFGSTTLTVVTCLFDKLKPANCEVVFKEIGWDITNARYDAEQAYVGGEDGDPLGLFFKPDGTKMYMIGAANDTVYQYTLSTAWDVSTATYDTVSFSVAGEDTTPLELSFKSDGTEMYVAGSTNDAVYQYTLSTAWDLSTTLSWVVSGSKSFSIAGEDASPRGLSFKPDGTKMYMSGSDNDTVYQYTLSTAWDVSTATYDTVSFSVAAQDTTPQGLFFKDDGTKMYMVGSTNDTVYQYTLSAAWDVSTATYDAVSFSIAGEDATPTGLFFKPDGAKFYMVGAVNDTVYQYKLPRAWALNNVVYDSKSVSVAGEELTPTGTFFKSDGLKMYVVGVTNDTVYQYTLSTAWDVSTATYDAISKSVGSEDTSPQGLVFKPDGTKMYMIGAANDTVYQYTLSTAWDVSTATYDTVSFSVTTQDSSQQGIQFKSDGLKMYIIGAANDKVYQYTLSTAWDLSTAAYDSVSFNVTNEESNPTGVFFKSDGLKMYVIGNANDTVYQYTLSTAWDISTVRYDFASFNINTEDVDPRGMFFKPDGLKFYIVGNTNDTVYQYDVGGAWDISEPAHEEIKHYVGGQSTSPQGVFFKPDGFKMYAINLGGIIYQYTLSTAWDLLTAGYDSISFSTTSEDISATGIFFKPDGLKMYMIGRDNDTVFQYTLSTAWDISTASYDTVSFSVASEDTAPQGMSFKDDGAKMYMIGNTNDSVYQYSLSTAWDLSTASYESISFSVNGEDATPRGVFFKPGGLKMYMTGDTSDTVYQYSLSTAWDVSTATYDTISFSVSSEDTFPSEVFFKPDGTKMYMVGVTGDNIYQYEIN